MDDPVEVYEQALAGGNLPQGPMLPQDLIKLFGIHRDDMADVFVRLRRIGLEPANPHVVLRKYEPEQVAIYLKQLIGGVTGEIKPCPIQRIDYLTYSSLPAVPPKPTARSATAEIVAELDESDGETILETEDAVGDKLKKKEGEAITPPESVDPQTPNPEQLVTPAEAARLLNKKVQHPGMWIDGLKRKGLVAKGEHSTRGRPRLYRLGDIMALNVDRKRRKS